ncbi:MAG: SDR family oxidoreductase [Candidatus Cloacimonetes bacterium]|nr:SDR family oxidoreductase [Candidatus Cloacimonadota bacterium]
MTKEKEKVFITGGTGLLGHYLLKDIPETCEVSCTYFPEHKKDAINHNIGKYHVDICIEDSVLGAIEKVNPDYIIHTASIASVDYIEKNRDEAERTNVGGMRNIIRACKKLGTKLIYISSNAIFDGNNPPYWEEDAPNPLNYYGRLKVNNEKVLEQSGLSYSIVRPILMYGWNLGVERKNPVTWLIDLLKENKSVNIVDDIFCNPLYVKDCADVIWKIIELDKEGVFHVAGEDEISRYDFACMTAEVFGLNKGLITPVKNSFFRGIAPRPVNTTYCTDKIKKELNIFPLGIRKGLEMMREARC